MVYIHFPSNLTEEELMLQAKYQKLKKKKKAIQAHKAPKQEADKPIIPKRPSDARDAREVARKLLKSGAIQAIQRPQTKQDQTSFKRPKGQDRKRVIPDQSVAEYQPFSSTQSDIQSSTEVAAPEAKDTSTSRVHNLYQQFATERDREELGLIEKKPSIDTTSPVRSDKPRIGNTIFVSGNKLTNEFLRNHFNTFGDIINISMQIEKGRGFITFSKPESADRAISEIKSYIVVSTVTRRISSSVIMARIKHCTKTPSERRAKRRTKTPSEPRRKTVSKFRTKTTSERRKKAPVERSLNKNASKAKNSSPNDIEKTIHR